MKITSTPNSVGGYSRLAPARPAPRAEGPSKAFSLKGKGDVAGAPAARAEAKPAVEAPVAAALRSVAADFKAGRIPNREEAVRKMVSTMLHEQFGPSMTKDRGYQKMEKSIAELISDDPMLS